MNRKTKEESAAQAYSHTIELASETSLAHFTRRWVELSWLALLAAFVIGPALVACVARRAERRIVIYYVIG